MMHAAIAHAILNAAQRTPTPAARRSAERARSQLAMQQALQDMLSTIYQPLPGPSTEQMMAALMPDVPELDDAAPDIDLSTLTQLQQRILALLARHGEMYGQDIMAKLELQNSTVYSSLARLEQMHLIRKRVLPENKKYKLYSLNWKTAQ
jgi:uncharacterized membrane protein